MFSTATRPLKLRLQPYRLPLARPWPGTAGPGHERRGWLLILEQPPYRGVGECAPLPAAGTETAQQSAKALEELPASCQDARVLWRILPALAAETPAVACALETALLDLESRRLGVPLRRYLRQDARDRLAVNAVAGEATVSELRRLARAGFGIIKLKVGKWPPLEAAAWVKKLNARLPAGVKLRLDANCAWSLEEAKVFIAALSGLEIDCIEEPLRQPDLCGLQELQRNTRIPLAVDESLRRLCDADNFHRFPVRRVVLKPMVQGGPRRTFALARTATEAGVVPLVTSTLESSVGLHAVAQLAAAVEALSPGQAHGLATSAWLAQDLAPALRLEKGFLLLDESPGLGITP